MSDQVKLLKLVGLIEWLKKSGGCLSFRTDCISASFPNPIGHLEDKSFEHLLERAYHIDMLYKEAEQCRSGAKKVQPRARYRKDGKCDLCEKDSLYSCARHEIDICGTHFREYHTECLEELWK